MQFRPTSPTPLISLSICYRLLWYCEYGCSENGSVDVFWDTLHFFWIYTQWWNWWVIVYLYLLLLVFCIARDWARVSCVPGKWSSPKLYLQLCFPSFEKLWNYFYHLSKFPNYLPSTPFFQLKNFPWKYKMPWSLVSEHFLYCILSLYAQKRWLWLILEKESHHTCKIIIVVKLNQC